MHFYKSVAYKIGTTEALELADRLAAWHDAMVSHERTLHRAGADPICPPDCPHNDVDDLWREARLVFGDAADELTFLKARASGTAGPPEPAERHAASQHA